MTAIPTDMLIVAAVAAVLVGAFQAGLALILSDRIGERRLRNYEGGRKGLRRDLLVANGGVIVVMAALGPFYVLTTWLPVAVKVVWGVVSFLVLGAWFLLPAVRRASARLVGAFGRTTA